MTQQQIPHPNTNSAFSVRKNFKLNLSLYNFNLSLYKLSLRFYKLSLSLKILPTKTEIPLPMERKTSECNCPKPSLRFRFSFIGFQILFLYTKYLSLHHDSLKKTIKATRP